MNENNSSNSYGNYECLIPQNSIVETTRTLVTDQKMT